ncbi:Uncharacterized protein APZ42_034534 [Daphnia magna]|uniref:Uncharacterized protein n=2 Tax=Daphnia magna TaxID=35525 RepID=A0A0P5YZK1_9CRUS|nr:hypothetical protein OUZ56_018405 [Daphnia magna]KZS02865.1 Uncharacterized protein APZ42_034534 [Daphnia magna]
MTLCEHEVPVDNVMPDETTTVVVNNVCAMEITLPSSSVMADSIATDIDGCLTYCEPTVNVSQHQSMSGDTSMLYEHRLPVQKHKQSVLTLLP